MFPFAMGANEQTEIGKGSPGGDPSGACEGWPLKRTASEAGAHERAIGLWPNVWVLHHECRDVVVGV